MKKIYPLKQAVITGFASAIFATGAFVIVDSMNQHNGWNINPATIRGLIGLLTLIILGIGIYAGMQNIKQAKQGQLTYGQALLTGFLVALTVGVVMAILGLVYTTLINPGYNDYMVTEGKKALLIEGGSPGDIANGIANLQKQFTPSVQAMQALVGQTVAGTLIALVMAAFTRSTK
jgi:hypothetical protein